MFDLFRMSPIAAATCSTGKYAPPLRWAVNGTGRARGRCSASACRSCQVRRRRGAVALLVLASIGIGIVVALVSDSDRQAVSRPARPARPVFFSGLVDPTSSRSVRAVSSLLPVTQAGVALQDLMLRGETTQAWRGSCWHGDGRDPVRGRVARLRRQLHRPA
jgi:hypothetical protein